MDTAPTRLAIGALSKRTGSKVETIRYYERVGLLPPPGRSAGGYRLYETGHLKRLTFVRRARALGFSIDEVGGSSTWPIIAGDPAPRPAPSPPRISTMSAPRLRICKR